ncbi:MAG TPA: bile acid:sodium symporter family protein [Gammaproteobacteria bacterium]|nr:bile acid:sodium symporter family protein [Gammaproteobacteria bacterium]
MLSAVAWVMPQWFTPWREAIVPLLMVIMFGMGMTLTLKDFVRVWTRPGVLAFGVALQYLVMPVAAWAVASLMKLPPALLAGMVLVGSSPGGTASNVICYLARGNVALSVSLTFLSTLLAFLLTPAFTWLLAGRAVPVPFESMLLDILRIVLAPVLIGAALNSLLGRRLTRLMPVFPVLSVAAIVIIIAIIVALNQPRLGQIGLAIGGAIVLHNGIGLLLGYLLPCLAGQDPITARTLAIETGMQNSGLAVALALKYFGAMAALPGALFSIWHNLSGALLASFWRRR